MNMNKKCQFLSENNILTYLFFDALSKFKNIVFLPSIWFKVFIRGINEVLTLRIVINTNSFKSKRIFSNYKNFFPEFRNLM